MKVNKFDEDEFGYLSWKSENTHGYIVNSPKPRKTKGEKIHFRPSVRLHIANCSSLIRGRGGSGEYTEKGYYKICGLEVIAIQKWCTENMEFEDGGGIDWGYAACKRCSPV